MLQNYLKITCFLKDFQGLKILCKIEYKRGEKRRWTGLHPSLVYFNLNVFYTSSTLLISSRSSRLFIFTMFFEIVYKTFSM